MKSNWKKAIKFTLKRVMKLNSLTGLVAIAGLSVNAHAAHIDMKPGLWEHTFKLSQGSLGDISGIQQEQAGQALDELKRQLANMSPEQRKMMEDVMAKQGIKISDKSIEMASQNLRISKDGTVMKACITQSQIDTGNLPQIENCDQKITQVSTGIYKTTFACKGEQNLTGEGQIVFQGDKAYTGTTKITTEVNNTKHTMEGTQSGKWLSSDCGDIKPQAPGAN